MRGLRKGALSPHLPPLNASAETRSSSIWAIMLEQSCQTLEGILGPFLEAVLCEYRTMEEGPSTSLPAEVNLPAAPYSAGAACELLLRHERLCHTKFPVTIRRRLEVASAVSAERVRGSRACRHVDWTPRMLSSSAPRALKPLPPLRRCIDFPGHCPAIIQARIAGQQDRACGRAGYAQHPPGERMG
jgi:hypothetical protein